MQFQHQTKNLPDIWVDQESPYDYRLATEGRFLGQRGIALLELAICVPVLAIIATSLIVIGQLLLNSSEVRFTIDEYLKSFILSETPNNWNQELNTLASFIANSLNKFSPNEKPQIVISLAQVQGGKIYLYNGSYPEYSGSPQPEDPQPLATNFEIDATNSELKNIIANIQAKQATGLEGDLTGMAITKVRVMPPAFPVDMGLSILWPSTYSRLGFLNLKGQF
jgi:hypothetical protein